MAKEIVRVKVCDRHRGRAEATVTRHYEWFGQKYRIDLCEEHDAAFREGRGELRDWIEKSECLTQRHESVRLETPDKLYENVVKLPGPEDLWRFSNHARDQLQARQIQEDAARRVAQFPDSSAPSEKEDGVWEHYGEGLVVVVNRQSKTIITVAGKQTFAYG
jgi:hypothetical protein